MRVLKVDLSQDVPLVDALILGKQGARQMKMVFDTGCGMTQIDTAILENLGYSVADAVAMQTVSGPGGDSQEGYSLRIEQIQIFGVSFKNLEIAAFDFENYAAYGIEGLLGFDIIKQLHIELDGPKGELRVY